MSELRTIEEFDVSPRMFMEAMLEKARAGGVYVPLIAHDEGCPCVGRVLGLDEGPTLDSCTCEIVHVVLREWA